MFHFPPLASHRLFYSATDVWVLPQTGCPIRISPGLRLFAPHRSFSQLTTSFIAFSCQGIHHVPLITFENPPKQQMTTGSDSKFNRFKAIYKEQSIIVELDGFEPSASALQGRRSPN
jgi:hypothetical protein